MVTTCQRCDADGAACRCPPAEHLLDFMQTFSSSAWQQLVASARGSRAPAMLAVRPSSSADEAGTEGWQKPTYVLYRERRAEEDAVRQPVLDQPTNSLSVVAFVCGLCSAAVPLAAVAGCVTGMMSLRRIDKDPWLPGHGASIAGILTSLALAPLGTLMWVAILTGRL